MPVKCLFISELLKYLIMEPTVNQNQERYTNVCAVKYCTNVSQTPNDNFFRFPREVTRFKQWTKLCDCEHLLHTVPSLHSSIYRVCILHFDNSMFVKSKSLKRKLIQNSFPNKNLPSIPPRTLQTSLPVTTPSTTQTNGTSINHQTDPSSTTVGKKRGRPQRSCTVSNTRQAAIYNQNIYQQYQHYAQKQQQQQQPVMSNNYPVHPDVKFKRLPFFDVLADLLKPSSLVPQNNQRIQESQFYFHLTPQQATDVASSRDIRPGSKCEYIKQIQLRFCLLETTCEQEDYFPPNVVVKVNNKLCPLPNPIPTNKPGVEPKRPPRPVNITPMVKLSPTVANAIHVSWAADYTRGYTITVALVHKRNSNDLLQRLKSRGMKHSDHTRGLIKEKLNEDADCEIATTCLRVSLMCPLGKMRMSTPCRSITCQHLQCFDASLFLQMNERKPTWSCPVCDKPALYDNLVIDGYFQDVLSSSSAEVSEIQLHKDGSWSTQIAEKKPAARVEKVTDDSIEIIADDVEVVSSVTNPVESSSTNNNTEKPKDETAAPKPNEVLVDLTCSDSEDDEPLAKRRALNPKPDSTNKFSDATSVSSSSNQSRVTSTPGPSSVSSSGYPASPSVINLDSPSPPRSPQNSMSTQPIVSQPSSCMMMSNGTGAVDPLSTISNNSVSMPFLDLESETSNTPLFNLSIDL
ncbi:E3 SUMO-protein ligase PIAS4 isoform X2 [Photinus pyralis]|uniref:E3 SUMO-protein ligase PIAS4 isoform X2 n=1 Tax=Photinus pyralis TaxID=7054 RepID=UPI0012671CE3|nr:E3 SUMO-protein ligase PIAS4 isoform X2 [Photinus pyralis]